MKITIGIVIFIDGKNRCCNWITIPIHTFGCKISCYIWKVCIFGNILISKVVIPTKEWLLQPFKRGIAIPQFKE